MSFSTVGIDAFGNTVTIDQRDRREGLYILGSTGTGKSTLLHNLLLQDINQWEGSFFRVFGCIVYTDSMRDVFQYIPFLAREDKISSSHFLLIACVLQKHELLYWW